jgi:hypothetical protein
MQTISYELAKRLVDKGFIKESDFIYDNDEYHNLLAASCWGIGSICCIKNASIHLRSDKQDYLSMPAAYTLDEILEFLPDEIKDNSLGCTKIGIDYVIGYYPRRGGNDDLLDLSCPIVDFDTEMFDFIEIAGLLLEWCIDNGYVKVEGEADDEKL